VSRVFERKKGEWWIDFKDTQRVRHRKKIGPNKRIAQEVLNSYLGKIARREHLGVIEETNRTFADFAADWLAGLNVDIKPRSKEAFGVRLKHLCEHFSARLLRSISAADYPVYVKARHEAGASNQTINGEGDVLKMILRSAVAKKLLARNPLLDNQGSVLEQCRSLKVAAGRVRYLNLEEIDVLLEACRSVACLREFVGVALNTGCRRNEILSMTYSTIDWQNRLIRIIETKNGDPKIVHLNDVAYDALAALPRRMDGRLWPFTPAQVSMAFSRIVRRIPIVDFRLHDLRHTYLSYQAMGGADARTLQELAGHRDYRMTMRYAHLSNEHLREVRNRVNLGASSPSSPARDANSIS
jgi:integrase